MSMILFLCRRVLLSTASIILKYIPMLYLVAYYPMLNELVLLGKTFLLYAVKKTTCDRPGNRNGLKPCPKLFIKRNIISYARIRFRGTSSKPLHQRVILVNRIAQCPNIVGIVNTQWCLRCKSNASINQLVPRPARPM